MDQPIVATDIAHMPEPNDPGQRAVVLLSGGLDSSTVTAYAASKGWNIVAVSFDYGQNHPTELDAARHQATRPEVVEHIVAHVDLRPVGGSALVGSAPVPKDRSSETMADEIPVTYVPARNAIFLAYGVAVAEARGLTHLFIGANSVDYSGYPDCRPEFLQSFQQTAALATKTGVEGRPVHIHAPLLALSKADIVRLAAKLHVDLAHTWTCYDPIDGRPCGRCDACQLRAKGFAEAGVTDPLL